MFKRLTGKEQKAIRSAVAQSPLLSRVTQDKAAGGRFEDILERYARLVPAAAGDVVFREGDYGGVLHFVAEGALLEVLEDRDGVLALAGAQPLFAAMPRRPFRAFWKKRNLEDIIVIDAHVRRTIDNMDEVVSRCRTTRVAPSAGSDAIVGALSALTRSPRPRTLLAQTPVQLLALHWRGMRDLMGFCKPVRRAIDALCRERIIELVRSGAFPAPELSRLPQDAFDALMSRAEFRFTGETSSEVTAVQQGDPVREVLMVVSGFGRIRQAQAGQSRSVGFVRRGDTFGLAALAAGGTDAASPVSLDFPGAMSLLVLPADAAVEHYLPFLSDEEIDRVDPAARVEGRVPGRVTRAMLQARSTEAQLVDFLVDESLVRGRQAMVIDQARCVGCDACVQACADTHSGVPRFVRTGPSRGGYAVANACMHCEEAPCLVNCPTDALFRKFTGEVMLSESLCIGCGTCAAACPYDNIRLVEMGCDAEEKENSLPVAVKCDLCIGEKSGPACVRACPHDAIARLDLTRHDLAPRLAQGASLRELRNEAR